MPSSSPTAWKRIAIAFVVLMMIGIAVGASSAAAHNPACKQTAGSDGPHYDDDPRTGSETAFERNPTLGGEYSSDAVSACDAGNS